MDASPENGSDGPSLVLVASICIVLIFGGLAIGIGLGGVMPLPYGPVAAVVQYVRAEALAVHVMAVAVFASSVPLAIYAATASARLRQRGVAGAAATLVLTGGTLAAGALGLTGLLGWTLSRSEISGDAALVRALYLLVFLVGGVGHIVALGLMVAGLAVAGLVLGLLPRPLAWAGVAIAWLCELTTLVLIWPVLGPILPVARILGLAWLVLFGLRIPLRRKGIRAQ